MRESSRSTYKKYQERNLSLFGDRDPFRRSDTGWTEIKGIRYKVIFWNGYSEGSIIIQADSEREAREKCIFKDIIEIRKIL